MSGQSTHIRVGSPTQPTLESEEFGPPRIGDSGIVRVHGGSPATSTTVGNQEGQADQGLEEVILSLPAPPSSSAQPVSPMVDPSSGEVIAKVVGASEAVPATLRLEASALRDPKLASELLFRMLLPTETNELLNVPHKEIR